MSQLYLVIKQQYFDAIASGEKTAEYRDIKPTTINRYLTPVMDPESGETTDFNEIRYTTLKLVVGYAADRDWMIVEVAKAEWYFVTDEAGNQIELEDKDGPYLAAEIEYTLGTVIELHRKAAH